MESNGRQRPTWVFGYGSLIWKQDFPFLESRPGRISGWSRRFWQGSHDHRGAPHDPGRVVTLIEAPGEICAGRAFLVEPEVFGHLDHREKNGYERIDVTIELAAGRIDTERIDIERIDAERIGAERIDAARIDGVVYRAARDNFAFLGPAPMDEMAAHINRSAGPSGGNRDYVLQLARALRELGAADPHVFELEARLLSLAAPGADRDSRNDDR